MGHRNMQFTGDVIDLEADQEHSQQHPDPWIFYQRVSNFPEPNYNIYPISEHHENSVYYGMPPPYNGDMQPQYPVANLDLAVGTPFGHHNPYVGPTSGSRDFPVQLNHGTHDQFSYVPCMDGVRVLFKRKNAEGVPYCLYQNTSVGPSSSFAPSPAEWDITQAHPAAFLQPEYGWNGRSRAAIIGMQPVLAHSASHVIQANHIGPSVWWPGNPWLDMNLGANNVDVGTFAWTWSPNLSYVNVWHTGTANGARVESGNMAVQGYQVTAINRGAAGFLHPPFAQGHENHHLSTQLMQVVSVSHPSGMAASSRRIPSITSTNTGIYPFQDAVDGGPTFLDPVPPTGLRLYRPRRGTVDDPNTRRQDAVDGGPTFLAPVPPTGLRLYRPRRGTIVDPNTRRRNLPHLRVLPEDEIAMLELPGDHEVGSSSDRHRDMRLDIDHMSYEELLALGEQIGSVGSGLSEEFIQNNLRMTTFTRSTARNNLEAPNDQRRINLCVVCQSDYEYEEEIGRLECGHEYHGECIKKWLVMKNSCPVCKSPGLRD